MAVAFKSSVRTFPLASQTSITMSSISVAAGDTLVACGMIYSGAQPPAPMGISDGSSLTWTKRVEQMPGSSRPYLVIWTAAITFTGTVTVGMTKSSSANEWICSVQCWSGVTSIGNVNSANQTGGLPTVSLTTTSPNSAVVMYVADQIAGSQTLVYDESAGTFTTLTGFPTISSFSYSYAGGHYDNVGAAGAKTFGVTSPGGQVSSIGVIELVAEPPRTYIYGDAADGYMWYNSPTYATAREGGGTLTLNDVTGTSIGQMFSGGSYYVMQGYFKFDVSGVTTFNGLDLKFYSQGGTVVNFVMEFRVHNWGASLTSADFAPGSTLAAKPLIASINTTSWPADGALLPLTVDYSALQTAITAAQAADGYLYLVAASANQRTNTAPTGVEYALVQTRDFGGTTTGPVLSFYTPQPPQVAVELWENGVLKQNIGNIVLTSVGTQTFTFNSSLLTALSGANVELKISSDISIDIDAVQWAARTAISGAPVSTALESWGVVLM